MKGQIDRCGEVFSHGKTNVRITVAKVIEFYVPTGFSMRVRPLPPQQRGRLIEFRLPSMDHLMDHLDVLLQKIEQLRSEIADIRLLNQQDRLRRNGAETYFAHVKRHERLQDIQLELVKLANLGSKVHSVEEIKEENRSRKPVVKRAS
jgi:hypothetical protein